MMHLADVSRDYLVHGDGRGERSQYQQEVEEERYQIGEQRQSAKHIFKDMWQCYEHQFGTFGRFHARHGEYGRKDDDARNDGHHRVDTGHTEGRFSQVDILFKIRGVSTQAADSQRKREESLSHSRQYHTWIDFAEVWLEQKTQSVGCPVHSQRASG